MPSPQSDEQQARKRFFILSMLRLTGAALVAFGLLVYAGKVMDVAEADRLRTGLIIILAGLVEAFWLPIALARKWKSPGA